jgi:hypothetical protein
MRKTRLGRKCFAALKFRYARRNRASTTLAAELA